MKVALTICGVCSAAIAVIYMLKGMPANGAYWMAQSCVMAVLMNQ